MRHGLLPRPIGTGRAARYEQRHLLRACVAKRLRSKESSLQAIRAQIASLSDEQLRALLPPPPRPTTPDGLPLPPPVPSYPSTTCELVYLMDGISLIVDPSRGAAVRRIADEIYRHYGGAPRG